MKIVGIRQAKQKFSRVVEVSQGETVIVTNHGKPVAVIRGVEGQDMEDVMTANDPEFWKMIAKRRKEPSVPFEQHVSEREARTAAAVRPKKRAAR